MEGHVLSPAELERLLSQSDWLRALARRLVGDAATADDLVQETWIAALRNPPDPDRPVRPWLAGVLRRVASMRARAEGRRAWRQRRAARTDELPSTSHLVEQVDTQHRLSRVVLELDEPYRTTLLLRYFHELPAVEIARRQGLPAGTVRWRLKRGLDDLRARLDRSWGDRRSWCLALGEFGRRTQRASEGGAWAGAGLAAGALVFLGVGWLAVRDSGEGALLAEAPAPVFAGERSPGPASRPELPAGALPDRTAPRVAGVAPTCELALHDPTGGSTAGLAAVLLLPGGVSIPLTSDERGVLRPPVDVVGLEGTLWVDPPGSFLQRVELELRGGLQSVPLPSGARLAGRVLHHGDPPAHPLELEIDTDRVLPWGVPPPAVVEILGQGRRARTLSGPDGHFAFTGLPANWSGELWLPSGWRVAGRAPRAAGSGPPFDRLHLDSLDEEPRVEVEEMPSTAGLVHTPQGEAASGARVVLRARWSDGRGAEFELTTDAQGRFRQSLPRCDLARLAVDIEHETGTRRREFVRRNAHDAIEAYDLGTLPVLTRGTRTLRVTDDGLPVAGAWFAPLPGQPVGPSDESGLLSLPRDLRAGWIAAAGYRPSRIHWEDEGAELSVELERVTRLALELVDAAGHPLGWAGIRPIGGLPRLEGPARLLAMVQDVRRIQGDCVIADAAGRAVIHGLQPGAPLELEVLDPLGRLLDRVRPAPLGRGESRAERAIVRAGVGRVVGTCFDRDGEVLVGVTVDVQVPGRGTPFRVRSDIAGEFAMDGLGSEPFLATASKRGFVRRSLTLDPRAEQPCVVRLELACDLSVRLDDPTGGPLEGASVVAVHGDERWTASEVEPGTYALLDLPQVELSIEWALEGAGGSFRHDPLLGDAELTVDRAAARDR